MEPIPSLYFPPFRLELAEERLYRDATVVAMRPKTFALLHYLLTHAGVLISKESLLDSLWPNTIVSEGGLTELMRELRSVLGDDARNPQFIETAHGRGYRFIAQVVNGDTTPALLSSAVISDAAPPWLRSSEAVSALVGRAAELTQLQRWLAKAFAGTRQLVFVTGEPGIGKTTLVETFRQDLTLPSWAQNSGLSESSALGRQPAPWSIKGQCIEQYGASEPYFPILEALGRLARQTEGARLIAVLQQYAPTWLAQMPALLSAEALAQLQRRVRGQTRERMLREMAEALEVLTAEQPLLLLLEDLHWSDYSTLDLLSFVAQRHEPARLMIVATYRPVEVHSRDHPLKAIKQALQLRGHCVELPLACLTEVAVSEYLEQRFSGNSSAPLSVPALARLVHHRTDGHPLFMVNIADFVAAQELSATQEAVEQSIPEGIRQMIELQIERLGSEDQRLLEVASVAGADFSAASVAAGLGTVDIDAVEQTCGELARRVQFLQPGGQSVWPDGTLAARYGFIHALYQNVLYYRVTPGRRARLHQRIGLREEAGYGAQAAEIATELAVHFEHGRDYERALNYLRLAGEKAVRRCANREAIDLFSRGLALLELMPESTLRARHELLLLIALGAPLVHSRGYAAVEVGDAYRRARQLQASVGETGQLFSVLWGLWLYYVVRGEHPVAFEIGTQLSALEETEQITFPWAPYAKGCSQFWLGEIAPARATLEFGLARYVRDEHSALVAVYSQDPRVVSLLYRSWTLWFLGYPDQALVCSVEAIDWAQQLAHPFSLAFAWNYAAEVRRLRREPEMTRAHADVAIALSTEQGFPFWLAWGNMLRGWTITAQGASAESITAIHAGLTAYEVTGAEMGKTMFLSMLAEAYGEAGQPVAGLQAIADAFAFVARAEEHAYEAELYRLKGALILQTKADAEVEAEACFLKSIEIAQHQRAKSWELRATLSLARLWAGRNRAADARERLAAVYTWFREGFDTRDLIEARALLEALSRAPK